MRVAQLHQSRSFQITDLPIADPAPGEVQVRVEACGICGSDLHYFTDGGIGDARCVYPMVMGHEPTGVVVKAGSGANWSPGDRVALEPAVYCYRCEQCLAGRHNLCANLRFLGSPSDPGFFREFINLPTENLLPLPSELGFSEGTLFEPFAVVLHSTRFLSLQPGSRFAVFGAGPVGLMTIFTLHLAGASRIWCVEPVAERRELALKLGADAVIDPGPGDAARQILAETGKRGVDAVFDCATRGRSLQDSSLAVRLGGSLVVTGIPSEGRTALDFHLLRRKEVTVFNVRRSNRESETALELLVEHRARLASIVTHEIPFEGLPQAFEKLEGYQDGMVKVVVRPR